jgi:hypothetical protein
MSRVLYGLFSTTVAGEFVDLVLTATEAIPHLHPARGRSISRSSSEAGDDHAPERYLFVPRRAAPIVSKVICAIGKPCRVYQTARIGMMTDEPYVHPKYAVEMEEPTDDAP